MCLQSSAVAVTASGSGMSGYTFVTDGDYLSQTGLVSLPTQSTPLATKTVLEALNGLLSLLFVSITRLCHSHFFQMFSLCLPPRSHLPLCQCSSWSRQLCPPVWSCLEMPPYPVPVQLIWRCLSTVKIWPGFRRQDLPIRASGSRCSPPLCMPKGQCLPWALFQTVVATMRRV